MDKIFVRDLLVRGIIGINPEERVNEQNIKVNIEISVSMEIPGLSDDIKDAVNYRTITKDVITIIENTQYFLIEKLSTHIAKHILIQYGVEEVQVTIDKPGALRFCESVAVQITRRKKDILNDCYLLIGSNINKEENIRNVYSYIQELCDVYKVSNVYETLAIDKDGKETNQESYYNMAFHIRSALSVNEIKKNICLYIESELNRERTNDKFIPRTIDLDIILFNSSIIDQEDITLPDPSLLKHAHVIIPLSEIAPNYIHPIKHESLRSLALTFPKSNKLKQISFNFDSHSHQESANISK